MGIRHPFDRLAAYYRDKIVDDDVGSNHGERTADILRYWRRSVFRNNASLALMERPQDVIGVPSFVEVMTWIYRHNVYDEHWSSIFKICHPCAQDWGAILRVETMETDGRLLALLVNSSRTRVPVRHSHETSASYNRFGKTLEEFFWRTHRGGELFPSDFPNRHGHVWV